MRTTVTNSIARSLRLSPAVLLGATGLAATLAFATPAARADFVFSGFATSASWHDDDFGINLGFSSGVRHYDRGWGHNAWRPWHGHYDRIWWRPSYYRQSYWYVAPVAPVIIEPRYGWVWDGYAYRWRIINDCAPEPAYIADEYYSPVLVLAPTPVYRDPWYYAPRSIVTYTTHYRPYGWYRNDCFPYSRSHISTSFIYSSNDWWDDGDRFSFSITVGNRSHFTHGSHYSPFTHQRSYRDRGPIFVNQPNVVINNPTVIVNNPVRVAPAPIERADRGQRRSRDQFATRDTEAPEVKGQAQLPATLAPASIERGGITQNPSRRVGNDNGNIGQPSRSPDRGRDFSESRSPRNDLSPSIKGERPTTIADRTPRAGTPIETPEIKGSRADNGIRKPSAILPADSPARRNEPRVVDRTEAKPQATPDARDNGITTNAPRRAAAPSPKSDLNPSNAPATAPAKPIQVTDSRDLGRRGVSGPSMTSPSGKPEARPIDTTPSPSRTPRTIVNAPAGGEDIKSPAVAPSRAAAPAATPRPKVAPQNVPVRSMSPATTSTPTPNVSRRPMPNVSPSIEAPVVSPTPKFEAEARRNTGAPRVVSPKVENTPAASPSPSPNAIPVPRSARPANSQPSGISPNSQRSPRIVSPMTPSPAAPSTYNNSPSPYIVPSNDDSPSPSRGVAPRTPSRSPSPDAGQIVPRQSRGQGRPAPSMNPAAPSPNMNRAPAAAPSPAAPARVAPAAAPSPKSPSPAAAPAPAVGRNPSRGEGRKG